jgi:hypothetical protein
MNRSSFFGEIATSFSFRFCCRFIWLFNAQTKISVLSLLGLVDFVNNVVPDAKLEPNGTDVFERLKDGIILWYATLFWGFRVSQLSDSLTLFFCSVSLSKQLMQVF